MSIKEKIYNLGELSEDGKVISIPVSRLDEINKRQTEREIGMWVYNKDTDRTECNCCHGRVGKFTSQDMDGVTTKILKTMYCPHCGALMLNGVGKEIYEESGW